MTRSSNAWCSVSCWFIYFLLFFLGMRISLPLFHSALSLPFILWCSVYQLPPPPPPTWNEISRRMVTKSNCFIWMMHPGIYVLFLDVIVIVFLFFLLCCSSKLFFSSHQLHVLSLFCVWTGSVSSHLSCIPSIKPVPSLSFVHVWCGSAAIVLNGLYAASDACWLALVFFFSWFVNHSLVMWSAHIWLCVISVLYNY